MERLSRITLICRDPERLADFYQAALGFVRTGETSITEPAYGRLIGIPGAAARIVSMQLGEQRIELAAISPAGRSYPDAVSGRSPLFQHFAIVVSDMAPAYERLSSQKGWQTISIDGPQRLPASSGGVSAYKFRDPDGHPLELLAFPSNTGPAAWQASSPTGSLGIDHSAISVADTDRSVTFYQGLGFQRLGGTLNSGPEQDKLDDIQAAQVEVTALAPPRSSTPHIELLCYRDSHYRNVPARPSPRPDTNDIAATRLVLTAANGEIIDALCDEHRGAVISGPVPFDSGTRRAMLRDPDGHLLCLEAAP